MAECLFNTAVPLTVRSSSGGIGFYNPSFSSNYNNQFPPFFTTNVTPVQFQDDSGKRVNSVVFEIYLHTIVANKKLLQLRISDAIDPFFMWQLDLNEEEFYSVRSEQNLLVDFNNFPYKLIELLQKCMAFPVSEPAAPFFAQLTVNPQDNTGTAILAFIERTSFRQVTQLSLKLKSVESDVLKKKLADLLRNYREQIHSLQSQLSTSNNYMNQNINTSIFNTPLSTAADAAAGGAAGNPHPPNPHTPHNVPTTKSSAKVHNLATGALVREKDEACAHLNQLYEVTKEAKTRIEEENSELKMEHELIKNQFQESQGEVQKANEIITKLQDEVRGLKAKLKSSASIADDQMNAAEHLRASNKRLQMEYAEVAEKAHTSKVAAETLERDNKTLQGKIQQLEIFLQQRDAVIAHHQRQSNIKDLDRAIRNLDEPVGFGGGSVLNFDTGITTTTTTTGATTGTGASINNNFNNNEEPTFESTGYVGSRIFDQTF